MSTSVKHKILWVLRILAALIMLQTLFYKFSAADEPVYIFSTLGMEPWGRIGTGVGELIASILLLTRRFTAFGAALGIGLMGGAIFFHLTTLGIEVQNDGGQLFIYAIIVMVSCITVFINYRHQLLRFFNYGTINDRKN